MGTLYKLLVTGGLVFYGAAGMLGWELGDAEKAQIPASVRSSPGGYRSYHFWHSGFHGGK